MECPNDPAFGKEVVVPQSRHTYQVLPTRRLQGTDVPWPHDVHIALPPSYEHGEGAYPVLWVTDASLTFPLVVGLLNWLHTVQEVAELIVIGVGAPDESDPAEFGARRTHDFYARPRWVNAGLGGARMEALAGETPTRGGGADAMLSFLVEELRPRLATEFRCDDDHGLVGFSGGGHFVGYALLSRPTSFGRYLAASPALSGCEDLLFTLEAEYAKTHDDLAARVFLGAGEAELIDPYVAAADIVGLMTRMAQLLRLRDYPSLELTSRLYPGQTHGSALSYALNEGLRTLYPVTTPSDG
jgi:predicted alpha/beta superfamily hydrolase